MNAARTAAREQLALAEERRRRELANFRSACGAELTALMDNVEGTITEIMVQADGRVLLERQGHSEFEETEIVISVDERLNIIRMVAGMNDRYISFDQPRIRCEIPGRIRFTGKVFPLVREPTIVMRLHGYKAMTLEDYLRAGDLTPKQYEDVVRLILERKAILVSGGPGTGKTTFLRAIGKKFIELHGRALRLVVIQEFEELRLDGMCVQNIYMTEALDLNECVKDALGGERPDSIMVGEIKGREALEVAKALQTGTPGGGATIHADNTELALLRLLDLIAENGFQPHPRLVANAFRAVIHLERDARTKKRCVKEIRLVEGVNSGGGFVTELLG